MSVFVRSGSYGNERLSFLTLSDRTETNDIQCFPFSIIQIGRTFLKVADVANSMAEDSLSVFLTPFPFFLHPYHVLPSPTNTISLLSFHAPLPVFPEPLWPVIAPPYLSFCTPFPVFFMAPCLSFGTPCLSFHAHCMSLPPLFACLLRPLSCLFFCHACLFITPSCLFSPLVCTSCTQLPVFLCTLACISYTPLPICFTPSFCLLCPPPCLRYSLSFYAHCLSFSAT